MTRPAYQAALDDFTEGLKQKGRTLDINTAKGRANQANPDNIAATALKVGSAMQLGGARQSIYFDKARAGFVMAAVAQLLRHEVRVHSVEEEARHYFEFNQLLDIAWDVELSGEDETPA